MDSTTKQVEVSRSERRRRSRERRRKRAERVKLEASKVSQGVSQAISTMKTVITFDDLDDDQLAAYYGIHSWWRVQKEIGGVANPLVIAGYAGCVDADTEFFSQDGWKRIADYQKGDKVLQYNPETDISNLVLPERYIKLKADELTRFKSQGIDQVLCDQHKVLYWPKGSTQKDGNHLASNFSLIRERHEKATGGWSGRIKTTFKHSGTGIPFTEGELRLQVAVNADGRIVKDGANNYTQMRFSKERKYLRLLHLCKRFGLKFKDNGAKFDPKYSNNTAYEVIVWAKSNSKTYDSSYYSATQAQLDIIADELHHWDGSETQSLYRYFSVNKCDADFVQYVYATQGYNTSIVSDKRKNKYLNTPCYTVNASKYWGRGYRSLQGKGYKTPMEVFKPKDGLKYCFTVPTGFLVLRRSDKIFTTGNCGKSALLSVALPALRNPDGSNVRVKYAAYTGKASNVLMSKGLSAQTIHSLIYECVPLGNDEFEFVLKEREDVEAELIVIDEASMVPDDMKKDLESLGIPVLYTGDHGQLPPVQGRGNVMDNPDFKLETPHRQAMDSGIIQVATAIRKREVVKLGSYGKYGDCEVVKSGVINDVKLLASADIVICYTNNKREELNKLLREYKGYSGKCPLVGEKLICVKNNKMTQMFNGLIVIVKKIYLEGGYLVMDVVDESGKEYLNIKAFTNYFEGEDHPKLRGKTKFDVFEFAYAITGHKSQGSQWDHVVVIEEQMFRQTMNIKRRWKYTTLTRAIKRLTYITIKK